MVSPLLSNILLTPFDQEARGDLRGGCWATGIPTATVPKLNAEYIAKLEDVLEERMSSHTILPSRLVYLDEKPVRCMLTFDPPALLNRAGRLARTASTNAAGPPTFSAR